jgi:uncharacterized protein (TIGR02147 family)
MRTGKVHNSNQLNLPLQDLLKTELAVRCEKNPRYSLRSFATSLQLSPAFLSKLLKGERRFTTRTVDLLAKQLMLNPDQIAFYKNRLNKKNGSQVEAPEIAYRQISLDQFQLISDWYHFAILELVTVENFDESPAWIAKRLNLNQHQVSEALDRLHRLGYLERDAKGRLILVEENRTVIGPEIAGPATHKQQTQILEKSIQALQEVPIAHRSQSSSTMAIPSNRIDEAKEIIQEFRRRLASLMQRPGPRDSVYQLSVSFFPLTNVSPQTKGDHK